ncbi:MAG TPA: hypothetical protein VJB16_07390, partial [archaeon]|nr:hypothetical protein [archaeon]
MASRRERRIAQRQEREDVNKRAHDAFARRQRNKRYLNIAILFVAGALLLYGLSRLVTPEQGEHDALAQCLAESGAVMYGTDWCQYCQAQKQRFGQSFRYVAYVNCDASLAACDAAGVSGYPTWTFPTGESLTGVQELA